MNIDSAHPPPPQVMMWIPLIFLTLPFLVVICLMARRKGKSVIVFFLIGLIPLVNYVVALWLASQTDAAVKRQLEELRAKIINNPLTK